MQKRGRLFTKKKNKGGEFVMREEIIGVIEVQRSATWGGERDNLFFTSNRVIVAKLVAQV